MKLNSNLKCPYCGAKCDGLHSMANDNVRPCEGDYSICIYCHGLLEYKVTYFNKLKIEDVKENCVKNELLRGLRLLQLFQEGKRGRYQS